MEKIISVISEIILWAVGLSPSYKDGDFSLYIREEHSKKGCLEAQVQFTQKLHLALIAT